jgi:hypothetical protein
MIHGIAARARALGRVVRAVSTPADLSERVGSITPA